MASIRLLHVNFFLYFYTVDGTFKISSALDFEDMTSKSYKIVVTATDGKDTATATISLTVTDQNETPVFHQTEYSVEQDESSVSILVFPLRCGVFFNCFPFYVSLLMFLANQIST